VRTSVLALLLLAACPAPEAPLPGTLPDAGEVLLTADGHPLHREVLDAAMKSVPPEQLEQLKASGQYRDVVEKMALGEVLYHRALADKMHEKRDVQLKMAIAERDALAQADFDKRIDVLVVNRNAFEQFFQILSIAQRLQVHPGGLEVTFLNQSGTDLATCVQQLRFQLQLSGFVNRIGTVGIQQRKPQPMAGQHFARLEQIGVFFFLSKMFHQPFECAAYIVAVDARRELLEIRT